MSFLIRTLVRALCAIVLGLAVLGWLGAAGGAIEPLDDPVPISGIEPMDNPIPFHLR